MIRKLYRAPDPELDAQLDLILKHLHDDRYPLKATTVAGYGITDAYTKDQVDSLIFNNVRPGTIVFVPRTTPWPGWIKANGALLSRTEYANLWTEAQMSGCLVSEATWAANNWGCYSTGDGSTTFRIPDLRAEFFRAADDGRGVDSGRTVGSYQVSQNLQHTHNLIFVGIGDLFTTAASTSGTGFISAASINRGSSNLGNTLVTVSSGGAEARSRNIALLACIKY